ncbi:EF-P 5-aminopentanol modification-associated protein YfmF [Geobacillus stearothermophilus]|uniref:EF-P 5-aminopentanol modification-associated protein YfmF n=1 Tax=Geobacillus stearothermophilus TaxID=1422 RepID=UPI0006AC0AC6|nr:pitrilysin family protein [Geobacillus stearothermophilus]KOR94900.1 zinc protease [Geobacillus stearothermophilus ATCC 12980]MED4358398.1 pitrilysin family protein [Geobacillus stearothermophilus]MED4879559.1 pitrilysin family protein [Geobacillus stearothermophilus]MED5011437.1 pitrilysin family protein [Geobacillus stearothermophilus]MED5013146.1 pitrilysin family protein [Geobacillus stearothermophilus]
MVDEKVTAVGPVRVHTISTDKYKTNTIVWKMKAPLAKETVTLRALLPYVLQSGTADYPSVKALRTYLDELYGATLNVDLTKKGEHHIMTIRIDVANERFLPEQTPLLSKALQLLADLLFRPALDGGRFVTDIVEQEKRALRQRIQAVYDDKMRYANMRLVEEMCKGEPYALSPNGELEDVDAITAERLHRYYERALAEDELDLYVIGDIDEEEVLNTVRQRFLLSDRAEPARTPQAQAKARGEVKEVIERQDVKQGKLNIGYRTNVTYEDDDYYALQMFNGIFGGFSHSKLFINVREKASLAYYAASRLESHKGLLMVMSGIEPANYEKARRIIDEQMQAMKNGDFTDEEMAQTKAVIRNQLLETLDTPRGLVEVLYHNVVSTRKRPIDEWMAGTDQVTREDVVRVADKVELDTVYFLTGMEATEDGKTGV